MEGTDGRKMSSSWGNVINITDEPNNMFGKVMSIPDELIKKYFMLATRTEISEIGEILKLPNPRDQKLVLAGAITSLYHGKAAAEKAKEAFINQFSKGDLPEEIALKLFNPGSQMSADIIVDVGFAASKSEARRLIQQGGVKIDGEILREDKKIDITDKEKLLQVGKRKFSKIKAKK